MSAMMRFPFLMCMSIPHLSLLPVLLLPLLPTVMMKFLFRASHTALLWFRVMVMLRFLSRAQVFLTCPPPPPLLLFALNLPRRLAAAADDLSGIVHTCVLRLLLLPVKPLASSQAPPLPALPLCTEAFATNVSYLCIQMLCKLQ
jgi:hypothetical protein